MGGENLKQVVDGCKVTSVIEKKLLSGEEKEFKIDDDIHFTLCRNNKEYSCIRMISTDIRLR